MLIYCIILFLAKKALLLRRECHSEHHELVVDINSSIIWLSKRDTIDRHKVVVGLYEQVRRYKIMSEDHNLQP